MTRSALLFGLIVFVTAMPGCGQPAAPPAGEIGKAATGDSGPPTKGLAKQDRAKMLENMNTPAPK